MCNIFPELAGWSAAGLDLFRRVFRRVRTCPGRRRRRSSRAACPEFGKRGKTGRFEIYPSPTGSLAHAAIGQGTWNIRGEPTPNRPGESGRSRGQLGVPGTTRSRFRALNAEPRVLRRPGTEDRDDGDDVSWIVWRGRPSIYLCIILYIYIKSRQNAPVHPAPGTIIIIIIIKRKLFPSPPPPPVDGPGVAESPPL